jgi:hypothetical protein
MVTLLEIKKDWSSARYFLLLQETNSSEANRMAMVNDEV